MQRVLIPLLSQIESALMNFSLRLSSYSCVMCDTVEIPQPRSNNVRALRPLLLTIDSICFHRCLIR